MPPSARLRRWFTITYWHPLALYVGLALMLGLVGYRVERTWDSVGLDVGAWKTALGTWFSTAEVLILIVSVFLLAVYDRLCLLTGQLNELIVIKAVICEDEEGAISPSFMTFLSGHGLGPSVKPQRRDEV